MSRPNVLFIMSDQQRADTIGPNRHPCANYPSMEALRKQSVNFEQFYASAMPCVPSRASFLRGKNAWNFECCSNARFYTQTQDLGPLNKTWMQTLRENGYSCISVGKTHMVHAGSFHVQVPTGNSFGDEDGWNHFYPQATPVDENQFFDIQVAQRTCEILQRVQDVPFALFVGFHAPHEPYVMPRKYLEYCHEEDVPLPQNWAEEDGGRSQSYYRRIELFRKMFGGCIDDEAAVRKGIAAYFGALKMVDDCLEKIIEKVKELGLWDNTLIVYTSDHGEMLGNHHLFNKNATSYQEESHIPFMMKLPGNRHAGKNISHLAAGIDWYPTVMDILNIEEDVPLPGRSLLPCIEDAVSVRDYVLTWYGMCSMAIRTKDYVLMYHPQDGDGELYNLTNDPAEEHNLYHDPAHIGIVHEMMQKMLTQRMLEDMQSSMLTRRELRLHREIYASGEPEVCLLPKHMLAHTIREKNK